MRERHAVGLSRVPLHLRDELVFVGGAGLEPAVAMKHPVRHPRGEARNLPLNRGKMRTGGWQRALQLKVFLAGRVAVEADGVVIDEGALPGAARSAPVRLPRRRAGQTGAAGRARGGALGGVAACDLGQGADRGREQAARPARGLGLDGATALTGAFGCYRLELPEGSWVDVIVAANAAHEAEEALAAGDLEQARAPAALAASLLRQPFLPGEEGGVGRGEAARAADVRASRADCPGRCLPAFG